MITIQENGEVYEVSFKYDPIFLDIIRNVPGRHWNSNDKYWTIPKDKLGWLLNNIKGTQYEGQYKLISSEHINENSDIEVTTQIPNIDISRIPYFVKSGSKPYPHQLDFMKFAIDRQNKGNMRGFICADEMGLGKTSESFNLAIYNHKQYMFNHCLILCCINSSKYNWYHDIIDHTQGKYEPYILGSRLGRNGNVIYSTGSKEKLEDLQTMMKYGGKTKEALPYFLILNIEAIRYKQGRKYLISDKLIELINQKQINMVIVDEIHKNASPTSMQGKQLLRVYKNSINTVEYICLTGTPIVNSPTDVFLPLKLIGGHNFSSFYTWCQEFCVYGGYGNHEIISYKNIPKLKSMLQSNMIRRLKNDVLDLPPKIYHDEYVENTPVQDKLYKQVQNDIISNRSKILASMNPLAKFLRLRQVNGSPELVDNTITLDDSYIKKNAKLQRIFELLEDIIDTRREKVVVFSNWVEPLRTLYRFISQRYQVCYFTGTMSDESREENKRKFQSDPKYKILLGTIGAAGITHTFTAANNVIFLDEPWNAAQKNQAEDRCHRVGTSSPVNIYTLLTTNTIDERVHNIVYSKLGVSKYIVDDDLDLKNNPDLFDLLML